MGLGGINEKVAGTIHTLVLGTRISVQGHPQINVSVVWFWNPWVWRDWCYKIWSLVACDEHHGFDLVHLFVLSNQNTVCFDKSWLLFQFLVPSLHGLAVRGKLFLFIRGYDQFYKWRYKQWGSPKLHHQKSLQKPSQLFWLSLGHTDAFVPSNLFSCFLFACLSLSSMSGNPLYMKHSKGAWMTQLQNLGPSFLGWVVWSRLPTSLYQGISLTL